MTHQHLIKCAIDLFVEQGYQATTVAQIARAAGTTPATFYRYFRSKADIARALQEHINVDVKKTLDEFDQLARRTPQAMRRWVEHYGEMWERMHVLCNAYWDATSAEPELAAELVPTTFRLAQTMKICATFDDDERREKFVHRFVLGYLLLDKLFHLVHLQGHNPQTARMIDEFSELFADSLFGKMRPSR